MVNFRAKRFLLELCYYATQRDAGLLGGLTVCMLAAISSECSQRLDNGFPNMYVLAGL